MSSLMSHACGVRVQTSKTDGHVHATRRSMDGVSFLRGSWMARAYLHKGILLPAPCVSPGTVGVIPCVVFVAQPELCVRSDTHVWFEMRSGLTEMIKS